MLKLSKKRIYIIGGVLAIPVVAILIFGSFGRQQIEKQVVAYARDELHSTLTYSSFKIKSHIPLAINLHDVELKAIGGSANEGLTAKRIAVSLTDDYSAVMSALANGVTLRAHVDGKGNPSLLGRQIGTLNIGGPASVHLTTQEVRFDAGSGKATLLNPIAKGSFSKQKLKSTFNLNLGSVQYAVTDKKLSTTIQSGTIGLSTDTFNLNSSIRAPNLSAQLTNGKAYADIYLDEITGSIDKQRLAADPVTRSLADYSVGSGSSIDIRCGKTNIVTDGHQVATKMLIVETRSMIANGAGFATFPSGDLKFAVDVTPKRNSDASFNGVITMSGTVDNPNVNVDDKVVRNNAIIGVLAWAFDSKPSVVSRQDRMRRCESSL